VYDAFVLIALAAFLLSAAYLVCALLCLLHFRRRLSDRIVGRFEAPVTLLKPLCGLEHELGDNLRSFCRQNYARYQIVFGVRDKHDPAIAIVRQVMAEFPMCDISIVIDERLIGANHKVSNLANMMAAAKHDILIMSDSDMRVSPDYIAAMVAPFAEPEVGATTCLYTGTPRGGLLSRLGAMYINDWFFPSSLIAVTLGRLTYCFGASIAFRRRVLDQIGGFAALADYIADDYMLGRLAHEAGHEIALAPYVIENVMLETSAAKLIRHEMRWARTIRSVQPIGYALSAVTETFAISLLASLAVYLATASGLLAAAPPAAALALRWAVHHAVWVSQSHAGAYNPWLIPVRDLLTPAIRIASYFGATVHWREQILTVGHKSISREPLRPTASP
jgi:ceramide glucosyltransferase